MKIQLRGWSVDRHLNVLHLMLKESGYTPVDGYFTEDSFNSEGVLPPEISNLIAQYFRPQSLDTKKPSPPLGLAKRILQKIPFKITKR